MAATDELLARILVNGRVCPKPQKWNELWELLPNRERRAEGGWNPPLPLILAAWWDASNYEKASRLKAHIDWASKHDCMEQVEEFLINLTEEDWHHSAD
tara:strand:- start:2044 stop:2340 length:297 start_codon:yes stop_codon:yes gene_type:complete